MRNHPGNIYSFSTFDEAQLTVDARKALADKSPKGASRRDFFKSAGVMVVGFSVAGEAAKLAAQSPVNPTGLVDSTKVDSWVSISVDETVTIYSGKCEFGQGFATVQIQLAAEELNVPLSRVKLIFCDTGTTPDQGVTSGSQSHIAEFGPGGLRQALDTARDALLVLAGQWFDVAPDALTVKDGVVSVKADPSQQITYGQLLQGQRFNLVLDSKAVPKDPKTYTVLGTSVPRPELPAKATGTFRYVQNVRLPGMLHGRVVRPPTVGAKVVSVDKNSVASMPGVVQVVVKNNFVGVVADTQWHAIQAAGSLNVTWSEGDTLPADMATVYASMQTAATADSLTIDTGDTDALLAKATKTFSAQYLHPFQMHGSMAASCAVADVRGGTGKTASAKIWSATQGVYPQRDSVALVLGIPKENIRVIFTESSGCYGLNGNDSVSYDAAILSQAVGKPVRVQWSRKDEHQNGENYGPAYVINLKAGVDAGGQITTWSYESWTVSKGNRPNATTPGNIISGFLAGFPAPVPTPAKATVPTTFGNNNNAASNYLSGVIAGKAPANTGNVNSAKVLVHNSASPFFTGPLRSPARLQNTYANEQFLDEIASALGQDPVDYRIRHLSDPRLIAVVRAAAQAAQWETRPSPKSQIPFGKLAGRGISCVLYEGNNGYSALVSYVEVDLVTGVVTIKKMITAAESGPISNPDGMINQTEGGVLQAMSRCMFEQVKWNARGGVITSVDWNSYPVFQWGMQIPEMKTVLINNPNVSQTGAGELSITLSASAIGNAIFDAIGVRVRQIPYTPANVLAAIAAAKK